MIDKATNQSPRNVQSLRKTNRGLILRALARQGQATRVELAQALSLTKMAISTIVSDLIKEGLVRENGLRSSKTASGQTNTGRRAATLSVAPGRVCMVGLWITRYAVCSVLMDLSGTRYEQLRFPIPERADGAAFGKLLIEAVHGVLKTRNGRHVAGIGVASLGPLDLQNQVLLYPPNFRGIGDIQIGSLLQCEFHLPVYMDNDINACAIAEQYYGLGRALQNLLYVGFGSGVGAGVILGGHVLHGGSGFAGELGHITTDLDGPLCSCGQRGCLELYTSTSALIKNSGAESIEALRMALQLESASEKALDTKRQYLRAIESALITVANLFDPDIVIIGEDNGLLDEQDLKALETQLNQRMFQHGYRTIPIVRGSFGAEDPLVGGAALVAQEIFRGLLAV